MQIRKLKYHDSFHCYDLINEDIKNNFIDLGWSLNQFKSQLIKENSFAIGLFNADLLNAFVIGNLINIEKKLEYEILLIYVKMIERKSGYADILFQEIKKKLIKKKLSKIYLEVASNNIPAINLYKKNNFMKKGIRKNYYTLNKSKIDAIYFEKIINE